MARFAALIKNNFAKVKNISTIFLFLLPAVIFIISLTMGRYQIGPFDVFKVLLSPIFPSVGDEIPDIARQLILRVRLPRIMAALFIGASYGVTGAGFQAIFKNPLVDSNILGVTSGAGFGAALALLFAGGPLVVQVSAFLFGLLAVFLSFYGSRLYKTSPLLVLTLMGILIGSFFSSMTSLLKYVADPLDTLPAITFWLLGSLTGITWQNLLPLGVIFIPGIIFIWLLRWRLNVLSLGDSEATALGLDPTKMKVAFIIFSALMTAAAVSVSGVIGWIGLVIPHAGRLIVGPDHKRLIPVSLSLGAAFLMGIDDIARTVLPGEIPLGILTGLIGVPILVLLMRQNRSGW